MYAPSSRPTSYLGAAFTVQYNLILLGGSALFSLASASPIPIAIGAGAELLWLAIGPRLSSFRSWVDGAQGAAEPRTEPADSMAPPADHGLSAEYSSRLRAVENAVSEVRGVIRRKGAGRPETGPLLEKLESVRPGFSRLCQLHQRLSSFLAEPAEAALDQEIARLDQAFTTEKDLGVRFTLRQAIVLAQKRKQERDRTIGLKRSIELTLEMIEKSLAHLRSRSAALQAPAELTTDLDGLVAQIASIDALEAEGSQAHVAASAQAQPA